jgi:hypothetical protein
LVGSCLDLASPTRGRTLAAFTAACLQTHLASMQEKHVMIVITVIGIARLSGLEGIVEGEA